ncbi:MAG: hypothetical protein DRG24_02540 [Epsilonproteobacteria bacterium]|nr:MAG: hypothetical protein DRG24_02540 [Campylobacterota bacterium]
MKNYIYNTDIGTFEIKQIEHLRYELWIEEELLGSYESAEIAAEDVATFNTDYMEWDEFENELEHYPRTLSEWTEVKEDAPY